MNTIYAELIGHDIAAPFSYPLAEAKTPYHFLTERHLQAMWLEQKYFKQLISNEGLPIQVLSPGIWNSEAGPDFLKAHIVIGSQEYRGDIELHLFEDSWYHHQHHLDHRYNQVVLHLSFWKPQKERDLLTDDGKLIKKTHLQHHLTISEQRILKLIDLDLYPYKHFAGSGHCARALFNKLPINQTLEFFRSAAGWRLSQKFLHLQAKIDTPSDYMGAGIALALGYKHNADAFLKLYFDLKSLQINDSSQLLAFALGQCGFFEESHFRKWSSSPFYLSLKKEFELLQKKAINYSPISLRLDKIRPANHPIRRLAVLSKIILDENICDLDARLKIQWQHHWQSGCQQGWKSMKEQLLALLPDYKDEYWNHHFSFEKEQEKSTQLMGDTLKHEILINICLPLLYANLEKSHDQLSAFQNFYASLPAPKTKKATYLSHRFFGNSTKQHLLNKADIQQGAYQLHHDFCIHYEASCQGCPFVERYKNVHLI